MLFVATVLLGISNVLLCHFFVRRFVTPALFYWIAWTVAIGSAEMSAYWDILPPMTDIAREVILQGHMGGFAGFFFSSLIFGAFVKKHIDHHWVGSVDITIYKKVAKKLVYLLLILGFIHVIYRLTRVGLGVIYAENPLLELRYDFSFGEIGLTRYFGYLSLALIPLAIFQGGLMAQANHSNSITSLLLIAAVINNMAIGGRQLIFEVFLSVVIGYFVALSKSDKRTYIKSYIRAFLVYMAIALIVFTVIGNLREGRSLLALEARRGTAPAWAPTDAISYAAVPLAALGPIVSNTLDHSWRTSGAYTFTWFFTWLSRVGLVDDRYVYTHDTLIFDREYIRRKVDPRLGWTQPTAYAYLVSDFGITYLWLPTLLILGTCQAIYLIFLNRGLIGYFVASYYCFVCFMTIDFASFFDSKLIANLIYVIVISLLLQSYRNERIIQQKTYE